MPGNLAPVAHHSWTTEEEQTLIDFLAEHASEAGNRAGFTKTTWNQATTFMSNNFLNIHSRQIKFPENGRGYVIYEPTIAY